MRLIYAIVDAIALFTPTLLFIGFIFCVQWNTWEIEY